MASNTWFFIELVDESFIVPMFAVVHYYSLVDRDAEYEIGSVVLFHNITPNDPTERRGRIIRVSENKRSLVVQQLEYEQRDEDTRHVLRACTESIQLLKDNMAKRRKDRVPVHQLLRNQLASLAQTSGASGSGICNNSVSSTSGRCQSESSNQLPYSNNVVPEQPQLQQEQQPCNSQHQFLPIQNQEEQQPQELPNLENNMPHNPRPLDTSTPQPYVPDICKVFRDQACQTVKPYVDVKLLNEKVTKLRNEITLLYKDLVDAVNEKQKAKGRPELPTILPWEEGGGPWPNAALYAVNSDSETVDAIQDESDDKENQNDEQNEANEPNEGEVNEHSVQNEVRQNEENEEESDEDDEKILQYRIYATNRVYNNQNTEAGPSTSRGFVKQDNNAVASASIQRRLSSDVPTPRALKRKMSSSTSNEPESPSDDDMVPIGSGHARVPSAVLKTIDWKSHTMATRQLLRALFPRSVLATHCLTGKNSPGFQDRTPKKMLDPQIVDDIVRIVTAKCNVPINYVRNIITVKCADESKLYRKRQEHAQKQKRQKMENDEGPSSLTSEGGSTSRTDSSPS